MEPPFIEDVVGFSRGSHKEVRVKCYFQASDKCRDVVKQEYRAIKNVMERNDGKYICLYCSKKLKNSGRDNPNCKYKSLNDSYLCNIDTEEKAYLLGWIASDGHISKCNSIKICIHEKDKDILIALRDTVCPELPIYKCMETMTGFDMNSKEMCMDACRHLGIEPGNKAESVKFFESKEPELTWAFIRGVFDGDGSIRKFTDKRNTRECSIASISPFMKDGIAKFCGIKYRLTYDQICFYGTNCVDFLSKIYDTANEKLRLPRKYKLYLEYLGYAPGLHAHRGSIPHCRFIKTVVNAFAPSKDKASDEGYDLWLISVDKIIDKMTTRYDTGIKVRPEDGFHLEILPRSSLSSSGYILANSVGLIDECYRGTLKIALTKVNPEAKDIEFPFKGVQMVLRRTIHFICDEDDEDADAFDDTARDTGGFGSTDVKT